MGVDEHTIEVDGAAIFHRSRATDGSPVLYLHSAPTTGADWTGLLELTGGFAPDLPGFGRSSKAGNHDYTPAAYAAFVAGYLDAVQLDQVALVGHGWGAAIGLMFAQAHPDRVSRLALVDAVPLLPSFAWPATVNWLRRPAIGELLMGSVNRRLLARWLRSGAASDRAWPEDRIDAVWGAFDQGTQRAILRLHRAGDPAALTAAGLDLGTLTMPAFVAWGEHDRWLDPAFAAAYGRALPHATVELIPGAGHWPWLEDPDLAGRLASFATGTM